MVFVGLPLALLALTSIPILAAIYWLRRQHRQRVVSSLVLWEMPAQARRGGMQLEAVRAPWLFLLEMGVLALLALAAAQPWVVSGVRDEPLIVVLDDSFSMQAGARERAGERVRELLAEREAGTTRFILAGARPRWLSDDRGRLDEAGAVLEAWMALSSESDLEQAIALGREVAATHTPMLVLTDRAPPEEPTRGVRWEAFGEAAANAGFVNATRSSREAGTSRVMLEVASFAEVEIERTLRLSDGRSRELTLEPGQTRRLWFEAPARESLEAELSPDALSVDDRVVLIEPRLARVRVALDVQREDVRQPLQRALSTMETIVPGDARPDVRITDRPVADEAGATTWLLQVIVEESTRGYVGPFVMDRSHPLTEGLSLEGAIWAAGEGEGAGAAAHGGRPLIAAGNVPLVSERTQPNGSRVVRWRWQPEHSTLQQKADFPALVWNLIAWRRAHLPGLSETNVRCGRVATLRVDEDVETVRVMDPRGATEALAAVDGVVRVEARWPGVYDLAAGNRRYQLAANPLAAEQSDLREKESGVWDGWERPDVTEESQRHRDVAWVVLLAVLGLLGVHGWLIARQGWGW